MEKLRTILSLGFAAIFIATHPVVGQDKAIKITSGTEAASSEETLEFTWDRTLGYDEITAQCRKLVQAYPDLVQMESIGETATGKRIWALTISNFTSGNAHEKPGYLVEGNTLHDPSIGSDHALYLAWHLLKNHETNQTIGKLLEHKVIYIIPATFPDTKTKRISESSKVYSPTLDNDKDGRMQEDGPDDLTNDGLISLMRRKSLKGPYVEDKANPFKMVLASTSTEAQYEWLGYEGFDNDKDGLVNEDPFGYQAIDQDWSWKWHPNYAQTESSSTYPFSIPENRAIKDFILKHPNIAAVQLNYYQRDLDLLNSSKKQEGVNDVETLNQVDKEELLNKVYQTKKWNWMKYSRGLNTFTVHLMNFNQESLDEVSDIVKAEDDSIKVKNHSLYSAWAPFEHPTYGPIEIGGLQISPSFIPEGDWLIRDLERFALQTIENASQLPQLVIQNIERRLLNDGLTEVTATIQNAGLLPTHTPEDLTQRLERADYITLKEAIVLASSLLVDGAPIAGEKSNNLSRIEVPNIPTVSPLQIRWVVKSTSPTMLLEIDSRKGGVISTRF
ncbi:hypothetical protein TH61_14905 [Rufibacter sp. DG15C]|uniref:M14 family metallopeptidase n=1 Tax=Rufibacter sp. DG15C TaxID=1379909 RepID=UPI00078BC4D9|nr:M14 family metallopeptidase [Rufibacter sp. DG15C]AMM52220.1 hypothetical protein TH61_14905 [Rufibacter sp. DG15C]